MAKYKTGEGYTGQKPLRKRKGYLSIRASTKGEKIVIERNFTLSDGCMAAARSLSIRPADKKRAILRRLIRQLPDEKLPTALDMLSSLVQPPSASHTVVPATDEEFRAVAQRVIAKYKPALERLAKR